MELNIEATIKKAVEAGIEAGRKQAEQIEQSKFDAYKSTERRLYALPDIKEKVEQDRESLQELLDHGTKGRSKDICRFQYSGQRLSEEEIVDALAKDIQSIIAKNVHEIEVIEDALAPLIGDTYYQALSGKYFDHLEDDAIAININCDPRTVRRNRGRLVRRVAVRLYGVDAL